MNETVFNLASFGYESELSELGLSWRLLVDVGGVFGLLLTLWTFLRLKRVEDLVIGERRMFSKLIALDDLKDLLRQGALIVRRSKQPGSVELSQKMDQASGAVEGVVRTLETSEHTNDNGLMYLGHYTLEFLKSRIGRARRSIDIAVVRPHMIIAPDISGMLKEVAGRGVKVRIMSLSPNLSEEILDRVHRFMPNPKPENPASLKNQLAEMESYYQANFNRWPDGPKSNLSVALYEEFPTIHMLSVDDSIYIGFPITLSDTQDDVKEQRPGILLSKKDPLGIQVSKHFDLVFANSQLLGATRK